MAGGGLERERESGSERERQREGGPASRYKSQIEGAFYFDLGAVASQNQLTVPCKLVDIINLIATSFVEALDTDRGT